MFFEQTYCTNKQVPDSACTATAFMSGVKTNFGALGVTANVKTFDCEAAKMPANQASSILQWAQEAGKSTGVVTTTRVTNASPAAAYAHVPYREFECDEDIAWYNQSETCSEDIAQQLVEQIPGKNINVSNRKLKTFRNDGALAVGGRLSFKFFNNNLTDFTKFYEEAKK